MENSNWISSKKAAEILGWHIRSLNHFIRTYRKAHPDGPEIIKIHGRVEFNSLNSALTYFANAKAGR